MKLPEKLKQARKLLGDTQSVASDKSGVSQSKISYMEVGKRKNIPEEYLIYLCHNLIDLNSLFNETKESETIEKNTEEEIQELKKKIEQQGELIQLQKDVIALRERKLNGLKSKSCGVEKDLCI